MGLHTCLEEDSILNSSIVSYVYVHICMYINADDVGSKKIMSYVLDLELQARLF